MNCTALHHTAPHHTAPHYTLAAPHMTALHHTTQDYTAPEQTPSLLLRGPTGARGQAGGAGLDLLMEIGHSQSHGC